MITDQRDSDPRLPDPGDQGRSGDQQRGERPEHDSGDHHRAEQLGVARDERDQAGRGRARRHEVLHETPPGVAQLVEHRRLLKLGHGRLGERGAHQSPGAEAVDAPADQLGERGLER